MSRVKHPYGYWASNENVLVDARKYAYQSKWKDASPGAFTSAQKHGWLAEACAHMVSPKVPMGYWTLDTLKADARNYQTRVEWKKASASAYATAGQRGLLAECCAHMVRFRKPDGYWTKARCVESAKKYKTIQSWSLGDPPAYDGAKRNGWMAAATEHMSRVYSHGEHTIYAFLLRHDIEFDYQKRFKALKDKSYLPFGFFLPAFNLVIEYHGRQHFATSKSSMFRKYLPEMQRRDAMKQAFALKEGMSYQQIDAEKVEEIEAAVATRLRSLAHARGKRLRLRSRELTASEQKKLANLGVWTKEAVLADALRFKTQAEWQSCGNAALQIAQKKGWVAEATAHMTRTQVPKGYWTKERVLADARKYATKIGWYSANPSAYQSARAKGWVADATAHMTRPKYKHLHPDGYWTRERVLEDARKYTTPKDWRMASRLAVRHAREKGWLEEATAHMTKRRK
jgi:hypothetical protein